MSGSGKGRSSSAVAPPLLTVIIALGSNLGDRRYHLLRAIHELRGIVHVVRVSRIHETEPVDAPAGSPPFFNAVVTGYTSLSPHTLMHALLRIEKRLGRTRRGTRNEPRIIDLDLILYSGIHLRVSGLTLPHPRAHERAFVLEPMGEVVASGVRASVFGPARKTKL